MPWNLNEFQYAAKAKIAWIIYAGRDVNLCTLHRHTAADPQNYERYRDIKRAACVCRTRTERIHVNSLKLIRATNFTSVPRRCRIYTARYHRNITGCGKTDIGVAQ